MSFVLDALRKSEHERQRQLGPGIAELPVARPARRPPWALVAIGLLVVLNVAVLAVLLLREAPPAVLPAANQAASPPPPAAPAAPAAPATEPAALIRPLAQEALPATEAAAPPPAPDPTLLPAARVVEVAPARVTEPAPAADLPPPISQLPAEATAGLPALSMDLHVYTDDPARRAVFINGRRYQRGGVLVEGPTVLEINREGAVLEFRGRRFLLPRL